MSENQEISQNKTLQESYSMYFTLPALKGNPVDFFYHKKTAFNAAVAAPCIPRDRHNTNPIEQNIRNAIGMTSEGYVRMNPENIPHSTIVTVFNDLPQMSEDLKKRILFYFRNYGNVLHNLRYTQEDEVFDLVSKTAIKYNMANSYDYAYYIKHNKDIDSTNYMTLVTSLIYQAKADIETEMKYFKNPQEVENICNNVIKSTKQLPASMQLVLLNTFNPENIMKTGKIR
ncbi:MAG: hypothetical protein J6W27_04540 [Alphaproteobacteria bacterium]|nr:hypothetical protein [Alphaproteobacteria bacterium]